MRWLLVGSLLLTTLTSRLGAQAAPDTTHRSSELRERIEKRFAERVKTELRLTDAQAARLKAVATEHGSHRRDLRHRERDLRAALDAQISDSTKADQESVARVTKELLDLRVEYAESWRREMGELSAFLTPVQRARLLVLRERLLQRVHDMRSEHRGYRRHGDAH